ncbi:MAG TPA: MBL fold metallo-hydrolase [Candidatus Bipolaricaulota bacterium]
MGHSSVRVKQLSERVWIYRHNWDRLEPAIGMILAPEGWVAVDGGNSPRHGQAAFEAMQSLKKLPALYVINTHRHFDHVFGNQAFHAPVIGSRRCRERFSANLKDDWAPDRALEWVKANIFTYNRLLSEADFPDLELVAPSLSFDGTMDLHFDGLTVRLFPLGGVHTDDHIGVHMVEEGVVFLGDALYFQCTPEGGALKLPGLLGRVAGLESHVYAAGHERPYDRETFERLHRYVHSLFDSLKAGVASGVSKKELLAAHAPQEWIAQKTFLNEKAHARLVRAAVDELHSAA